MLNKPFQIGDALFLFIYGINIKFTVCEIAKFVENSCPQSETNLSPKESGEEEKLYGQIADQETAQIKEKTSAEKEDKLQENDKENTTKEKEAEAEVYVVSKRTEIKVVKGRKEVFEKRKKSQYILDLREEMEVRVGGMQKQISLLEDIIELAYKHTDLLHIQIPKPKVLLYPSFFILLSYYPIIQQFPTLYQYFNFLIHSKGVLISGPSGVGKSLLIKYIASHSHLKIINFNSLKTQSVIYLRVFLI